MAAEFGVTSAAIAQWEAGVRLTPGPVVRLIDLYLAEIDQAEDQIAHVEPPPLGRIPRSSAAPATVAWLIARSLLPSTVKGSIRQRIHQQATARYVEASIRLRGLTMKWAQLAWNLDLLLSDADRRALVALESVPIAMSPAQVAIAFLEEFGVTPREAFAEWSTEPLASASIGQVHAATLRSGERVAVKVQYPKVVAMMEADLANIRSFDSIVQLVTRTQTPDVIHETLRRHFLEECDYRIEARNQTWLRESFAHRPDIHIPRVFERWSTRRVLTTELVSAPPLASFVKQADTEERDRAGTTIWSFFYTSAIMFGGYNTDPNPGNVLFGSERITFLDFGRVQHLSPEYVRGWRTLSRAVLERDRPRAIETLVAMGYAPRATGFDFDPILRLMWLWSLPCLRDEPFTFTREYLEKLWTSFVRDPSRIVGNYTADMAFLSLFLFGVGNVLAKLRATVPCRSILLDLIYEPGEVRPSPYTPAELEWLV